MDARLRRGGTSFMIAEKYGCRMDSMNYCDHHIGFAEQVARKHGWDKKVDFHFANMVKTPFPDQAFDFIVSNETTMCVDIHELFGEIAECSARRSYVATTWCRNDAVEHRPRHPAGSTNTTCARMHKRSTYFEALAANGLVPYRVTRHTEEAVPYWVLRNRSVLRTGWRSRSSRGIASGAWTTSSSPPNASDRHRHARPSRGDIA